MVHDYLLGIKSKVKSPIETTIIYVTPSIPPDDSEFSSALQVRQ
jgi:hypothetical protein